MHFLCSQLLFAFAIESVRHLKMFGYCKRTEIKNIGLGSSSKMEVIFINISIPQSLFHNAGNKNKRCKDFTQDQINWTGCNTINNFFHPKTVQFFGNNFQVEKYHFPNSAAMAWKAIVDKISSGLSTWLLKYLTMSHIYESSACFWNHNRSNTFPDLHFFIFSR